WTEKLTAHEGRFYRFDETGFEPKPARAPVPILIGGDTPAALKRAARSGDGWFGLQCSPETAAAHIKELRNLGAGPKFEFTVSPDNLPSLDDVRRFRDSGVDRLVLLARALSGGAKTLEASLDGLSRFADSVMNRV